MNNNHFMFVCLFIVFVPSESGGNVCTAPADSELLQHHQAERVFTLGWEMGGEVVKCLLKVLMRRGGHSHI